MNVGRLFSEHPASVGENYFQHMGSAFYFAVTMFVAALACFIHGILPFVFTKTGKEAIQHLHTRMVAHRHRCPNEESEIEMQRAQS